MSNRCSCHATTTGRKCRLKSKNKYNNKIVCHVHADILFGSSALSIQKMYIGYRTRQKIKNLFLKLPTEIQKIVLWYMREPLYIKRYYSKLSNILVNKTTYITLYENNINYYENMVNSYVLYTKYIKIISQSSTDRLYRLQNHLLNLYRHFIQASNTTLYNNFTEHLINVFKTYHILYENTVDMRPDDKTYLRFNF